MSENTTQPKISLKQRGDEIAKRLTEVGQAGIAAAFNGYRAAAEQEIEAMKAGSADVGTPKSGQ